LLAANPIVLFLLTDSVLISLGVCLAIIALLLLAFERFRRELPTVYLINVIALFGVFAHAELVTRVRFNDYVMEDLYQIKGSYYFNRPFLHSRLTDKEFDADYITNKDGFRIGRSQQFDISYKDIDWLVIGDSYTQGAQVQFEELYTSLLYRRFPHKIVANAGISGWGIVDEYEFLQREGIRHKPELVVLQVSNFNDFMKVEPRSFGVSDYLMQYSLFVRFLLQNFKYQNPATLPIGRWAEPFYPDDKSNRRYNVFYSPSSPEKHRDIENFGLYLRKMTESLRRHRIRLVVILLPTKEQVRFRYLEEVVTELRIDPRKLDMDRPNAIIKSLADSLGIELLDLTETFRLSPKEPYFSFDEHLTPYGHVLVADALSKHLIRGPAPEILSQTYRGDRYPSYTPDGTAITYHAPSDGNIDIFLADSAFRTSRRLTFRDIVESHATTGRPYGIAYTEGDAATGRTKVVVSSLSGGPRRTITKGTNFGAIPSFSPDGRLLAFAGWAVDSISGRFTVPRIFIADLESGTQTPVTKAGLEVWRPVFSPNGRALACIGKVGGQYELFITDLSNGTMKQLTSTSYDEWDPAFSPDGTRLVFAARQNGNWDLFVLDLATRKRTQLTFTRGDEWDPVYAPDGRSIVYAGEFGVFRGIYRLPLTQ
jgi:Tol biopolymer transport system component